MIRLTILVCFPREDEQVPVDWERETREPVSYTHLDVYKRQAPPNTASGRKAPMKIETKAWPIC